MGVAPDAILIYMSANRVSHLNEWPAFFIQLSHQPIGVELLLVDKTFYASDRSLINRETKAKLILYIKISQSALSS